PQRGRRGLVEKGAGCLWGIRAQPAEGGLFQGLTGDPLEGLAILAKKSHRVAQEDRADDAHRALGGGAPDDLARGELVEHAVQELHRVPWFPTELELWRGLQGVDVHRG